MISTPITYVLEDQGLVDAFQTLEPTVQTAAYWSDGALSQLKVRVKNFYIAAQKTRCCYCARHLGTNNHRLWDIEHIIARAKRPGFMFTPTNLAASCPDCNNQKADKEVLVNINRVTYPSNSRDYVIVHPHFDEYGAHVWKVGFIYVAKTEKGRRTIDICNLHRFAIEHIDWKNSPADTSFEPEVDKVFEEQPEESARAVQAIVAKLRNL